jgi:hypothetical protein
LKRPTTVVNVTNEKLHAAAGMMQQQPDSLSLGINQGRMMMMQICNTQKNPFASATVVNLQRQPQQKFPQKKKKKLLLLVTIHPPLPPDWYVNKHPRATLSTTALRRGSSYVKNKCGTTTSNLSSSVKKKASVILHHHPAAARTKESPSSSASASSSPLTHQQQQETKLLSVLNDCLKQCNWRVALDVHILLPSMVLDV